MTAGGARAADWIRMDRAHYIGDVPGHGEVLLALSRIVGDRVATARSVRHGIEIDLHACTESLWPICVSEEDGSLSPIATWEGQLSKDESVFEGDWVPSDGGQRAPIRLERIATERALRADTLGLLITMPEPTGQWFRDPESMNGALVDWAEARLTDRRRANPPRESTETWSYEIEGVSASLLSLRYHVDSSDPSTGDAAREAAVTLGFATKGTNVRVLSLQDLARPGVDLAARLDALAVEELEREGATSAKGEAITSFGARLDQWTAGPSGLTFRFAPLHLPRSGGSSEIDRLLPEQLFALTLPYARFDELLDPNGPLAEWLDPER